jgi:3-oxoacyl-[acyl-carrier protein] reductase
MKAESLYGLSGTRAIACGSTQGIGRACAMLFAELGASVTLVARNESALRQVLADLPNGDGRRHDFLVADFNNPEDVRDAMAAHLSATGPAQVLLNNTGGPPGGAILSASPEDFTRTFARHVLSNQLLAQCVIPGMRAAGYGRIVNVISTSVKEPIPGLGVSNTIRGAVASWAKTLASELASKGITVNNVLPGSTQTPRIDQIIDATAAKTGRTHAEVYADMVAAIPMQRFAQPEETAAAVAFLCSPAAAYITGVNLPVDGGRTRSL